jgi:peptide-methionine (S)-S-oxide reductase
LPGAASGQRSNCYAAATESFSTRVGYTGGENVNPTAFDHPGHAVAVVVVFDPEQTSYRDILEFFFQIHRADLDEAVVGSDYRSELFYTPEEQRQVAEDTLADADADADADAALIWTGKIVTKISQRTSHSRSQCPYTG